MTVPVSTAVSFLYLPWFFQSLLGAAIPIAARAASVVTLHLVGTKL